MKWFKWSKGGPLPVPNPEPPKPPVLHKFTQGWSCGKHSSSEWNYGVCADCGEAARQCVIKQRYFPGVYSGGLYISPKWIGAEFVRWDGVEHAHEQTHS